MLANNYIIWWIAQLVAIAILVYLFLRWRPGFMGGKTIGETMGGALDTREGQIRSQLDAAQQSRDEAERIHSESQREITEAREQSEQIVARASETGQAIQQEIQDRAREEYTRIVGQAATQIEYERERAEQALRRSAADIVVDAAGQVIEKHLEAQTDRRLIMESLQDMREFR